MSPDVLFSIGFLLILFAAVGGGWLLGREYGRDTAYWDGYDDARAQAEEFIVIDDHEAVL